MNTYTVIMKSDSSPFNRSMYDVQADSLVISPTGAAVFYAGDISWSHPSGSIIGNIIKVIVGFESITLAPPDTILSRPGECGKEYRKGPVSGLPIFCTRSQGHDGECTS